MDLDDIIYIVVTIVIFIVSILGKTKKPAEPIPEIEDEQEYNLNEFEKLLMRKEEFMESMEEQDLEEIEEEDDSFVQIKNEREKDIKEERKKMKEESKTEEEKYEDGFDVKSAIIYSSILERKRFRH